jgi:hypothetical protein
VSNNLVQICIDSWRTYHDVDAVEIALGDLFIGDFAPDFNLESATPDVSMNVCLNAALAFFPWRARTGCIYSASPFIPSMGIRPPAAIF